MLIATFPILPFRKFISYHFRGFMTSVVWAVFCPNNILRSVGSEFIEPAPAREFHVRPNRTVPGQGNPRFEAKTRTNCP